MAETPRIVILGAGVSGLAAALQCHVPVLEAGDAAGGLCASYALHAGSGARVLRRDEPFSYRFDIGGGHWIHSRYSMELETLGAMAPLRRYRRDAAVYISKRDLYIPYPVQLYADHFPPDLARRIAGELRAADPAAEGTIAAAHLARFGPTLNALFFAPFHDRYTAGLAGQVLFRERYKTPSGGADAGESAEERRRSGYNSEFVYPAGGLGELIERWSGAIDLRCNRRVTGIDRERRLLSFADGGDTAYDAVVSTLPLHEMQRLASIPSDAAQDPWTSVLVMNIGGIRGARCPRHHWLYVPDSDSGFHRVGFYSNVDADFLPVARDAFRRVGMYVECSYPGGSRPLPGELAQRCAVMAAELQSWGYIAEIEVSDASWVDTAYTWIRPGSRWREEVTARLRDCDIHPAGRFGMWENCGIADSMRDASRVARAVAGHRQT